MHDFGIALVLLCAFLGLGISWTKVVRVVSIELQLA